MHSQQARKMLAVTRIGGREPLPVGRVCADASCWVPRPCYSQTRVVAGAFFCLSAACMSIDVYSLEDMSAHGILGIHESHLGSSITTPPAPPSTSPPCRRIGRLAASRAEALLLAPSVHVSSRAGEQRADATLLLIFFVHPCLCGSMRVLADWRRQPSHTRACRTGRSWVIAQSQGCWQY